MSTYIGYFVSVLIMGLAAGFSPGPTATLVITQTMRYGITEGIKIAAAPILTDIPIIALTLTAMNMASPSARVLGVISILGALFLVYLAFDIFRETKQANTQSENPNSWSKGFFTNLLNPGPYLFWITVGSPKLVAAFKTDFYLGLILSALLLCLITGSKILISVLAKYSTQFLLGERYKILIKSLGILLFFYAISYFADGLHLLGISI